VRASGTFSLHVAREVSLHSLAGLAIATPIVLVPNAAGRLAELGAAYGDLPAHDGLWEAALATRHDLAARLAVVPLVLEARGLDVTPAMIGKLRAAGDDRSADILEIIYRDEIGHVRVGQRWFAFACAARGLEPARAWHDYVETYFKGELKPPFNTAARAAAGMPAAWYEGTAPV